MQIEEVEVPAEIRACLSISKHSKLGNSTRLVLRRRLNLDTNISKSSSTCTRYPKLDYLSHELGVDLLLLCIARESRVSRGIDLDSSAFPVQMRKTVPL